MKKSVLTAVLVATTPALAVLLTACGKDQPPAAQAPPPVTQTAPQPQATIDETGTVPAPTTVPVDDTPGETYSPEALESLLAPVALYPDPVLAQVLATSTNPQEVLDAGNWLLQNADLTGDDLQAAATSVGFTPPMVALVQFPTVVDMMCMEMDWTSELGSAFIADEPGVLDAVQRLRQQAADMGNLQSSEQMKVATETQNSQQVIIVEPAQPEIVYVPQYDPATVYTTPAPTQVANTTVATSTSTGHSTGAMVTTGLLAFGAGILVNEIFDDDDDNHNYYYPSYGYGYGRPPYYPPPYRPRYGNGYRPAHSYSPPKNYKNSFNNNNIYINTGNKNYFSQFEDGKNNYRQNPKSPITAARPNRPELDSLNQRSRTAARPAATRQADSRQVQGSNSYAGAREKVAQQPGTAARPATGSYAGAKPGARDNLAQRPATAVKPASGSYAGAKRPAATAAKPQTAGARDRGRIETANRPTTASRPAAKPTASRQVSQSRPSGLQGMGGSGKSARAASQRGRDSMPKGAKGKSGLKKGKKR
ncbi:MAG: DUF3300 domain-containing protein [Halieaceae bacterium]|jgi:hypothetical protein|nr:DUF3300 domain-containing protein [Halieaceae bacterium]